MSINSFQEIKCRFLSSVAIVKIHDVLLIRLSFHYEMLLAGAVVKT